MGVYVCVCVCEGCMCTCVEARGQHWVCLLWLSTFIFETVSLVNWGSLMRLASRCSGISLSQPCLPTMGLWVHAAAATVGFYLGITSYIYMDLFFFKKYFLVCP